MSWMRLATIVVGAGLGTLAALVPVTAPFAIPAAAGVLGWAIPHPSDSKESK